MESLLILAYEATDIIPSVLFLPSRWDYNAVYVSNFFKYFSAPSFQLFLHLSRYHLLYTKLSQPAWSIASKVQHKNRAAGIPSCSKIFTYDYNCRFFSLKGLVLSQRIFPIQVLPPLILSPNL